MSKRKRHSTEGGKSNEGKGSPPPKHVQEESGIGAVGWEGLRNSHGSGIFVWKLKYISLIQLVTAAELDCC